MKVTDRMTDFDEKIGFLDNLKEICEAMKKNVQCIYLLQL